MTLEKKLCLEQKREEEEEEEEEENVRYRTPPRIGGRW
jgi:hypothetical protein